LEQTVRCSLGEVEHVPSCKHPLTVVACFRLQVFVTPDFKWTDEIALKGKAPHSTLQGHDALRDYRNSWHNAMPNLLFTLTQVLPVVGNKYLIKFDMKGTFTLPFGEIVPTGKEIHCDGLIEIEIVGGARVIAFKVYSGFFIGYEMGIVNTF